MIPSVVVNLLIIAHDLKISTNTATVLSMPKAATVYIPGSFKYICLVIVDVVESSFPPMESYYIGHSYKATNSRNTDFSKLAHKMLGRNTDKPAVTISMTDCFAACQLCQGLLYHVKPSAIEIQLSVLSTSRFGGFLVWTDPAKPKKPETLEDYLSDLGVDDPPDTLQEWMALCIDVDRKINEHEIAT